MGKILKINIYLFALLLTIGCSKYQRMLKSTDYEAKHQYAMELYGKGEYYKVHPILEELIRVYKGTPKAEELYYLYAKCEFFLEDYELAAFRFGNFVKNFGRSKHVEECSYMVAHCYYLSSPPHYLDQEQTTKAINEYKLFLSRFPESDKATECNNKLTELFNRLERKSYELVKLYHKIEDYRSAVIAAKNMLAEYPGSKYTEEIRFMRVESAYKLSQNSIELKKEERLIDAIKYADEFIRKYPSSESLAKVESYKKAAEKDKFDLVHQLPAFYFNTGRYTLAIREAKTNLKKESAKQFEDKIIHYMIRSHVELYTKGFHKDKFKNADELMKSWDKYAAAESYKASRFYSEDENWVNKIKSEKEKLHLIVPKYYFDNGYYLDAIEEYNKQIEAAPQADYTPEFRYNRMQALNKFIGHLRPADKMEKLEEGVAYAKEDIPAVGGTPFESKIKELQSQFETALKDYPYIIPINEYSSGKYFQCVSEAKKILENNQDVSGEQKDEIAYTMLMAINKTISKAKRVDKIFRYEDFLLYHDKYASHIKNEQRKEKISTLHASIKEKLSKKQQSS